MPTSAAVNQQGGWKEKIKNHSPASDSFQSLDNLHSECVRLCVCVCVCLAERVFILFAYALMYTVGN